MRHRKKKLYGQLIDDVLAGAASPVPGRKTSPRRSTRPLKMLWRRPSATFERIGLKRSIAAAGMLGPIYWDPLQITPLRPITEF